MVHPIWQVVDKYPDDQCSKLSCRAEAYRLELLERSIIYTEKSTRKDVLLLPSTYGTALLQFFCKFPICHMLAGWWSSVIPEIEPPTATNMYSSFCGNNPVLKKWTEMEQNSLSNHISVVDNPILGPTQKKFGPSYEAHSSLQKPHKIENNMRKNTCIPQIVPNIWSHPYIHRVFDWHCFLDIQKKNRKGWDETWRCSHGFPNPIFPWRFRRLLRWARQAVPRFSLLPCCANAGPMGALRRAPGDAMCNRCTWITYTVHVQLICMIKHVYCINMY